MIVALKRFYAKTSDDKKTSVQKKRDSEDAEEFQIRYRSKTVKKTLF